VKSEDAFTSQIASYPSSALLVIYFHTPWAAPCKQMSSVLEALATTYSITSPPSIGFFSIDAEEAPGVCETYDVTAVPYVVLQRDGKTLETISGSDSTKVRNAVEKYALEAGATAGNVLNLPPEQKVTKPVEGQEPTTTPAVASPTAAPIQQNGSAAKNFGEYAPTSTPSDKAAEVGAEEDPKDPLNVRLRKLTLLAPVMLFMKGTPSAPQCGFSRQVVGLLRDHRVRYGFFNILADDEVRQGLKEFSEWPTYPQLYVDGDLIGGIDLVSTVCLVRVFRLIISKVREQFEKDPEFLAPYSAKASKAADSVAA
jgi:Grx4 family monothiol glutaredoxin